MAGKTEAKNGRPTETLPDRIRAILAKPYWDYAEAALILNLDVKTLRNMKWRRELCYTRFGRKVYFSREAILKELKSNMVLCPASALRRGVAGETAA